MTVVVYFKEDNVYLTTYPIVSGATVYGLQKLLHSMYPAYFPLEGSTFLVSLYLKGFLINDSANSFSTVGRLAHTYSFLHTLEWCSKTVIKLEAELDVHPDHIKHLVNNHSDERLKSWVYINYYGLKKNPNEKFLLYQPSKCGGLDESTEASHKADI